MTTRATLLLPIMIMTGFSVDAVAFQPFFTDDTGTQGTGGNQLELSVGRERATVAGAAELARNLPLAFARGLTEAIDFYAGTQYEWVGAGGGDANGINTASVGLKWRPYQDGAQGISLALKPELRLPLASSGPGSGFAAQALSGGLTLIATQELPVGAVHFNLMLAADRYRDSEGNPNTITTQASLAPVWNLGTAWKLGFEIGTSFARAQGVTIRTDSVGLGAVYSPNPSLDLAFGISLGADNDNPRTTTQAVAAGITRRFQ